MILNVTKRFQQVLSVNDGQNVALYFVNTSGDDVYIDSQDTDPWSGVGIAAGATLNFVFSGDLFIVLNPNSANPQVTIRYLKGQGTQYSSGNNNSIRPPVVRPRIVTP